MEKYIPGDTLIIKPLTLRTDKESMTETIKASEFFKDLQYLVLLHSGPSFCEPCRNFDPIAHARYDTLKDKFGSKIEWVFVSHDGDDATFLEVYKGMGHFPALPYDTQVRANLTQFADGVPTVNIIDAKTGEMICEDATQDLAQDEKCDNFPYKPKSFAEIVADLELIRIKDGSKKTYADLAKSHKSIALLFSAGWCGPCVRWSPVVQSVANAVVKKDESSCAFILVSWDRSQKDFDAYSKHYYESFYAIEFGHPAIESFNKLFQVQGVPTFISAEPATGKVINEKARNAITGKSAEEAAAAVPWVPVPPALVVEFQQSEECFEAFYNQKLRNAAVILQRQHVPSDAADDAAEVAAYTEAAKAYKAANPADPIRFLISKRGPKSDEPQRDKNKCTAGHPLQEVEKGSYKCDACRGQCEEKHNRCHECDQDYCVTCYNEVRQIESGDAMLWRQLSQDIKFDTDSAKGSKKPILVKFSLFEHNSVVLNPVAFDKQADLIAFFGEQL